MTNSKFAAGDPVRTLSCIHQGVLIAHPTNPSLLIAVMDDGLDHDLALVVTLEGTYPHSDHCALEKMDVVREAWDALDGPLRDLLSLAAQNCKLTAIRAFRHLTGASLLDAKRAIETFPGNNYD